MFVVLASEPVGGRSCATELPSYYQKIMLKNAYFFIS